MDKADPASVTHVYLHKTREQGSGTSMCPCGHSCDGVRREVGMGTPV